MIDEGERLVLSPTTDRFSTLALIVAWCLFLGLVFTLLLHKRIGESRFLLFAPTFVMTCVAAVILAHRRGMAIREIRYGPTLIWDRATDQVSLPRRRVSFARSDLLCLEFTARLHRSGGSTNAHYTLDTYLDAVVGDGDRQRRFLVLWRVRTVKRFAQALATEMSVPLQGIE